MRTAGRVFSYGLVLVPLSLIMAYIQAPPSWVFITATIAIVPLAEWIRRGTEQLAKLAGPAIGGLLNVTFGNMAELILALFVLAAGRTEVVKAQIIGSMIGNGLLGLGLGIIAGSWGRQRQTFRREPAGLLGSLLILSVIALLLPALFAISQRSIAPRANVAESVEGLSLGVAIVLIGVYVANLVYTLLTHRDVFSFEEDPNETEAGWPLWMALGVLIVATAIIAVESELVSRSIEGTASHLGLSPLFLGVTVLALVGNASEYLAAIYFARIDRMGFVVTITVGSTIQVALLTAPLLALISYAIGHPMNLVFRDPVELLAVGGTAFAVNAIAQDGETTWFEGVFILAVYALFGLAFFFLTPASG